MQWNHAKNSNKTSKKWDSWNWIYVSGRRINMEYKQLDYKLIYRRIHTNPAGTTDSILILKQPSPLLKTISEMSEWQSMLSWELFAKKWHCYFILASLVKSLFTGNSPLLPTVCNYIEAIWDLGYLRTFYLPAMLVHLHCNSCIME